MSMWRETLLSIVLTMLFSIGAGVLFVRTIISMIEELFFDDREEEIHSTEPGETVGKRR